MCPLLRKRNDGDPVKCRGFLLQFELYLTSNGEVSDQQKTAALINFLSGTVRNWAAVVWKKGGEPIARLDFFLAMFCRVFNHVSEEREVDEGLMSLMQEQQSVVEYALKFRTLSPESEWNKPALKAVFRHGLNSNILTELACWDDKATLDSLIDMSIKIDHLHRRTMLGNLPTCSLTHANKQSVAALPRVRT